MIEILNETRNINPEIAALIEEAVTKGEIFGLKGKRSIVFYNPKNLTSASIVTQQLTYLYPSQATYSFDSIHSMIQSIQLSLVSPRTFINGKELLEYQKLLSSK